MLRIFFIMSLGFLLFGCGEKSVQTQPAASITSIKPATQIAFENEIKKLNANIKNAGAPGTRAYEEANKALENFWDDKQKNMSRVDDWVCMYSNSSKWDPKQNVSNPKKTSMTDGPPEDDEYKILGAFCTDVDIEYKPIDLKRGSETTVRIKVANAPNIESLYAGDVIAISGPIQKGYTDGKFQVMPLEIYPGYKIHVDADTLKIVKKGS